MSDLYKNSMLEEFCPLYSDTSNVFRESSIAILERARDISLNMSEVLEFHHIETKSFHELWAKKEEV